MNKIFRTALVLAPFACASFLFIVPATAQSVYGSIFGTVTDKTGAAVAGATITVKDEAKGTVVEVTSNASGDYTVPHLIPDVYDLKVSGKGFKTFETKGISVEADTAPRIDPTMDVGGGSETIEVNAETQPELKTESSDVSTVFDQQQTNSLPVGDQNFANLQLLLPGAQMLGWSHAADENPQASKQIQIDGQAFGGTAFELDGTDNQDPILGIIVINPAMDSVTETKITTQNFDAELGKAVSAVVTAQTKSGTNNFHGSAYDFRTGNANSARNPYNQAPLSVTDALGEAPSVAPGLKNRLGGSIGGPILKDKFFFFANYEGQRQKVGSIAVDTLPTNLLTQTALGKNTTSAAQLAAGYQGADFSEYLTQLGAAGTLYPTTAAQAAAAGVAIGTPYPHNVIPASLLSPQALNLLTLLAPYTAGIVPNSTASVGGLDSNYAESGTGIFNSDQWTERLDYTINEKMHAFERFSRFTDLLSGAVMFGTAGGPGFGINNYGGNSQGANDSLAGGMDIAVNPKLLTDFRLGYYRYNIGDQKHDAGVEEATALGIPGINIGGAITSGSPGFFPSNLPGGSGGTQGDPVYGDGLGVNRCNCPLIEREDQFQVVNNWTKILGNHSIKIGADLRYGRNLRVPSDNDRAGILDFGNGPTENPALTTPGGLSFATMLMGDVTSFNRYVSTSTNAKEFQKRTFFYGQDTWRATRKLTLNLGLRWDLYFPESTNGPGNGSLLNLADGYLHVAGIGSVPSNLGWTVDKLKQFAPRLGITYQLDPKTVVRAGYGRSFDTGVFGSIFGHTITQNIPVLANQQQTSKTNIGDAFTLAVGPTPNVMPTVPTSGLLPNPGATLDSSSRPNPLNLTTVDAWNLSVQRALTPTTSLTVAYVANKGTHTLGDGDSNGTNPNEAAVNLPGANSITGQTLHFDPSVPAGTIAANGGTSTNPLLQRYFAAALPACSDPAYVSPGSPYTSIPLPAGDCGWTNGIAYRADDQNTEFDALQVTLAKQMSKGVAITANYQWASAFDENSTYYTWSHSITHMRDSNVRDQQITAYGSYDLPFGRGKQFAPDANGVTNAIIGGWQLSGTTNWAGGLPFTLSYNECGSNINDGPCDPSQTQKMKTHLTGFLPGANGVGTRIYYPAHSLGDGTFVNPGLDTFGNAGQNTYRGPRYFGSDMAFTKSFSIWESVAAKFRVDAYNVFNHIAAGNPSGNIESLGVVNSGAQGYGATADFGPRVLEFSARIQF
jgi:Carboxypeptidase regulatory-like domain/TonB dependent receptor